MALFGLFERTDGPNVPYNMVRPWRDLKEARGMAKWAFWIGLAISIHVCTQILASDMGNDPRLGPRYILDKWYGFWQAFIWIWRLVSMHHESALLHVGTAFAGCIAATLAFKSLVFKYFERSAPGVPDTKGSAHFATAKEVAKMEPLQDSLGKGVYLATYLDESKWGPLAPWFGARYLVHNGESNLLVVASPGTGKTAGNVIPTALSYQRSMVVLDPKAEIYQRSAGWRQKELGSKTLLLDLADETGISCKYNPLDAITLHTDREIRDVQGIVNILSDPDGKGFQGNDLHFASVASSFISGVILHVCKTSKRREDRTFKGVDSRISNPLSSGVQELLKEMKTAVHDPWYAEDRRDADGNRLYLRNWRDADGNPTYTDPFIAQAAQDMIDKSETERTNVLSTAKRFLLPCRDPIVAKNMEYSDFDALDFQDPRQVITLYLSSSAAFKQNLKPIHRVIINQLVTRMIEELPTDRADIMRLNDARKAKGLRPYTTKDCEVLFMLDEFATALGKVQIFADTMNLVRGYGIRVAVIVQDYAQIEEFYTKDESITSSTQVTVIYTPNKIETAEKISRILGKMTWRNVRKVKDGKKMVEQFDDQERDLMKADEVRRIARQDAVVLLEGEAPIFCKRIGYYRDPEFLRRSEIPMPTHSDTLPARKRKNEWNQDALAAAQDVVQEKLRREAESRPMPPQGGGQQRGTGYQPQQRSPGPPREALPPQRRVPPPAPVNVEDDEAVKWRIPEEDPTRSSQLSATLQRLRAAAAERKAKNSANSESSVNA